MSITTARSRLTWDEIHKAKVWGTCPEPMMARFTKRRVKDNAEVLEIGCGIGANLFWLAMEGYRAHGIDISPTAIERLRQRRLRFKPAGIFISDAQTGDMAELPWNAAYFDAVIDVCALQHVQGGRASVVLRQVHRVLKPGGWFFSMTASDRHDPRLLSDMPTRRETAKALTALYRAAGFEIVSVQTAEHTDNDMTVAHHCLECHRP